MRARAVSTVLHGCPVGVYLAGRVRETNRPYITDYDDRRDFYHVNDYFGDARAPSVSEADLSGAQELVSRAYGSRLSAARAA